MILRTLLMSSLFLAFLTTQATAQNYTQFSLPEGAIARFGKGPVNDVQYSPDGTRLAVASPIGIWLYDTTTHREMGLFTGQIYSVAFSPDGQTLASGSDGMTVRLWDVVTGEHKHTLKGHTAGVTSVAFSPDGEMLASGSNDMTVRLWDAVTGEPKRTRTYRKRINSVAFSPDGQTLAMGTWPTGFRG